MTTEQPPKLQKGHQNWVRDVALHPQRHLLYSVSDDRSIRCWDLEKGKALLELTDAHAHFVTAAVCPRPIESDAASLDTKAGNDTVSLPMGLVTSSVDGDIRWWRSR